MLVNTALLAVTSLAFAADAAPAPVPGSAAVTPLSFTQTCNNITWSPQTGIYGWLSANCLSGNGDERIQSAVYLQAKLMVNNNAQKLAWKTKASDPDYICNYCDIVDGGKTFSCRVCSDKRSPIEYFPSSINLEEHIANYAGHLLSSELGPPVVPTTNIPPPSKFWYRLDVGGLSTDPTDKTCGDIYSLKSLSPTPRQHEVDCLTNSKWTFENLQFTGAAGGAWRISVFDNAACTGTPFQVVKDAEYATCLTLAKTGVAVKVEMLWNGDI